MKFLVPDGDGAWQNISINETDDGVKVDAYSVEDATAIIEANKQAQKDAPKTLGKGTQSSMRHIATLGVVMVHELKKKGIYDDDKALRKWLNDLDNELWRTISKTRRGGRRAVQGL